MHTGRTVIAVVVAWVVAATSAAPVGRAAQAQPQQQQPAQTAPQASPDQQDLSALSNLVDAVSSGQQQPPSDLSVTWLGNHFIKSQGNSVYIPFTVAVDRAALPAASVALYVRAVSTGSSQVALPGQKPSYPWDSIGFLDVPADGRISRAIALSPGTYHVYVGVKTRGTGQAAMGLVRHELTVPALDAPGLKTSSVILATAVEQLQQAIPPEKQQENPYVFGPLKVTPALDRTFSKSGEMQVLFWIYGASDVGGKPDVQVDYNFHQRQPDGSEKYFNKTQPQMLDASTLPPDFNLAQGHQLLGSVRINKLDVFPEGDYRLEITVTDKPSGMKVVLNETFKVSAS